VAEDHREREAQEQGVQRGVVAQPRDERAADEQDQPTDPEPRVARHHGAGHEARAAGPAQRAARQVPAPQPEGQTQPARTAETSADAGQREPDGRAEQHQADQRAELRQRTATRLEDARQLQPLPRDHQHCERLPPRQHVGHRLTVQPEGRSGRQTGGARRLHGGPARRVAPEQDDEGAGQRRGPHQHERAPRHVARARGEPEGSRPGAERRGQGPAPAQDGRLLEPDQRGEEAGDHQRSVLRDRPGRQRHRPPARAHQPSRQSDEQREASEGQERQTPDHAQGAML
jgi:hypothetical protein